MFTERDYQIECEEGAIEALTRYKSAIGVLPTGGGKTIIFAKIIRWWLEKFQSRVLVLAHREELIWQAEKKIAALTDEHPSVEMADQSADGGGLYDIGRVLLASVQTLNAGPWCRSCFRRRPDHEEAPLDLPESCSECIEGIVRRLQKFDPAEFGLIITDEAHHAVAASYRRIYRYFDHKNPHVKHLGVTATADRADEEALGKEFEAVAFSLDILDLINEGWLVPILQQWVHVESIDLTNIKTVSTENGRDLAPGELEALMIEEKPLHGVCEGVLQYAGDRPTLIFAVGVKHAHLMADILKRTKPGSAICIDGTTDPDERRRALKRYAEGQYQYLVGCGVFLEGFDEPRISCVAMARPTKSRPLYAQAIGRGTRPILPPAAGTAEARKAEVAASSKPDLLVLDFAGNSAQHKLISTADILGGRYADDVVEKAVAKARAHGKPANLTDDFAEVEKEIEEQRQAIRAREFKARVQNVDPFNVFDLSATHREPGFCKGRKPTRAQINACVKLGLDERRITTFFEASRILDAASKRRQAGLATYRQVRLLGKKGINATDWTFDRATQAIDRIVQNGWRVPADLVETK